MKVQICQTKNWKVSLGIFPLNNFTPSPVTLLKAIRYENFKTNKIYLALVLAVKSVLLATLKLEFFIIYEC